MDRTPDGNADTFPIVYFERVFVRRDGKLRELDYELQLDSRRIIARDDIDPETIYEDIRIKGGLP